MYLNLDVLVGTCGFSRSRKMYFSIFDVVELQETFYSLPSLDRAKKLKAEAPRGFEYTVKAWQIITHPYTSPTWKKLKVRVEGDIGNYGYLRPTPENINAWEMLRRFSLELGATFIVFQTPSSFPLNRDSIKWVRDFFSTIDISEFRIGWELRYRNIDREIYRMVCSVMRELGIVHITDLMKESPCYVNSEVVYTRLHGLNGLINYKYKYTDSDLEKLIDVLSKIDSKRFYVLFNNVYMFEDAKRFKEMLSHQT